MEPEGIIGINDKYYNNYNGDIIKLEQNKLYFIYLDSKEYEQINFYLVGNRKDIIKFDLNSQFIVYLEKDYNYALNFDNLEDLYLNSMIKLDRKSINSEVFIEKENITLNSNNLYYKLNDSSYINNIINLKIRNDNALIEILFKRHENEVDIIDLKENISSFALSKRYNFIKIPKKFSSKVINFKMEDGVNSLFFVEPTYTIAPYCLSHQIDNDNKIPMSDFTFNITEHYKDNVKLMEDEYYYVIIQTTTKNLKFEIKVIDTDEEITPIPPSPPDDENEEQKEQNSPNTKKRLIIIISIICGVVLILIIIIIIIIHIKKKKNSSEEIQKEISGIGKNDEKEVGLMELNN